MVCTIFGGVCIEKYSVSNPLNHNFIDPSTPSTLKADFASHIKGFDYVASKFS